ncbi:hypothetical protein EXIGLDRAFT_777597 [Exidia glandulosa HHB12029]|uniref:Uncharacterized protein n=1 Tax=Exidia glandulosa HHB12029 TaxID=1314781 RepID=A0A165CXY1_EXIGL|nr:hypothetical protein EXIGLDRAFT_777597 [Exidia glandulosa HHB12029]
MAAAADSPVKSTLPHPAPLYKHFPFKRFGVMNRVHANMGIEWFTKAAIVEKQSRYWRFVRALANAPVQTSLLQKTLHECRISQATYDKFIRVVLAPSVADALAQLEQLQSTSSDRQWLLWHIFSQKTDTLEGAVQASTALISNHPLLRGADTETVMGCMVLAAHALARLDSVSQAVTVISTFLDREDIFIAQNAFYVNSMLIALSRQHDDEMVVRLVKRFVEKMLALSIPLSNFAIEHLLASKSTTLDVVGLVHEKLRMESHTTVDRTIVQDYINILAKQGAPGTVAQVLAAIIAPWPQEEQEAATEPAVGADSPSLPHFPSRITSKAYEELTPFEWISYFSQVAKDLTIEGKVLLDLYETCHMTLSRSNKGSSSIAVRRKIISSLISGLVRRGDIIGAVQIWDEYKARHMDPTSVDHLKPDRHILATGVFALARDGRLREAFDNMNDFALRVGEAGFTGGRSKFTYPCFDPDDPTPRPRVPLTAIMLNSLFSALNFHDRPDAVFAIWDVMEATWGVAPDHMTLDMLLKGAARAARLHAAHPVREEMEYIRFRMRAFFMPWHRDTAVRVAPRGSKDDPALLVSALLSKPSVQSTLWRGVPAWQRARYVFRSVVLGNWPELETVVPPAVAVRQGDAADFDLATPPADSDVWELEVVPDLDESAVNEGDATEPELTDDIIGEVPVASSGSTNPQMQMQMQTAQLRYPSVIPSHLTFHYYISMLGQCGVAYEIAQALAWMRALHLYPRRATVALALVYWRTVTDDAPSVEIYEEFLVNRKKKKKKKETGEESEPSPTIVPGYGSAYMDLVRWLDDWVPSNMPTEEDLRKVDHYRRAIVIADEEKAV